MSNELDEIIAGLSDADKQQLKTAEPVERWKARLQAEEAAKLQPHKVKNPADMTHDEFYRWSQEQIAQGDRDRQSKLAAENAANAETAARMRRGA